MKNKFGWEIKKLGEVLQKTESIDPTKNPDKEFIYIDVSSVDNTTYKIETTTQLIGKDAPSRARKLVRRNDVLFATVRPTLKRIAIIPTELDEQVCSTGYFVLRGKDIIDNKFLFYYLRSERFINNMEKLQKGAGYPAVSDGQIRDQIIHFPKSLPTQHQIVSELDALSEIISKKKQQLQELDKLAQATFYDMFGDPVTNEKGWEKDLIGNVFNVSAGGTPKTNINEYWDNGTISWIGSNMCKNNVLYSNDGKYITELGLSKSSAKIYKPNTILVALVGATIGKVSLLKFHTSTNQNIAGIDINSNLKFNAEFVFYMMMNLYHLFMEIGDDKFKMANLSFVRNLPIITPPISLQNDFATKIESIESQKSLITQSIAEVQQLFDYTMDKYFE